MLDLSTSESEIAHRRKDFFHFFSTSLLIFVPLHQIFTHTIFAHHLFRYFIDEFFLLTGDYQPTDPHIFLHF